MRELTEEQRARKAETARENGRKSKGPKTPEGKRSSSLNGLSHGLTANQNTLLSSESAEQYDEVLQSFIDDLRPVTKAELRQVQRIANLDWRLERLVMMETCLHNIEAAAHCEAILERFKSIDAIGIVVEAWKESCKDSSPLELLRRYQSTLSRQLDSAYKIYESFEQRRQKRRNGGIDLEMENYQPPKFETLRDPKPTDVGDDWPPEDLDEEEHADEPEVRQANLRTEPTPIKPPKRPAA